MSHKKQTSGQCPMSRRAFLKTAGIATAGIFLAGCGDKQKVSTPAPPLATKPVSTSNKVAIGKALSYDTELIRKTVRDMVDSLGGLGDVVSKGDRVAIKTNLTGGVNSANTHLDPIASYLTHPEVVRAAVYRGSCLRMALLCGVGV